MHRGAEPGGQGISDFTNKIWRKTIFQKNYEVHAPQFKIASAAPDDAYYMLATIEVWTKNNQLNSLPVATSKLHHYHKMPNCG